MVLMLFTRIKVIVIITISGSENYVDTYSNNIVYLSESPSLVFCSDYVMLFARIKIVVTITMSGSKNYVDTYSNYIVSTSPHSDTGLYL